MTKTLKLSKHILFFAMLFCLAIASCKKDPIDGGGDDDNKGGGEVSDETIELTCEKFAEDLKLENSGAAVDYIINCSPDVTGDIEIEPGTVIAFGPDASLRFTTGTLKAVGTDENPIIFRGEEQVSGFWAGIEMNSNSNDNQLSNVIIRHAGSSRVSCCEDPASLSLRAGRVSISDLTVEKGASTGILIFSDIRIGSFSRVKVTTHESYPLALSANQLGIIDGKNSDFSGNTIDLAYVYIHDITKALTIQKINIPYYINNTWNFHAEVDIDAGTQFVFTNSGSIYVADNGSLAINGQSSDPVIFKGEIDEPGSWKGIHYGPTVSSKNSIKSTRITGAGLSRVVCCGPAASLSVEGVISISDLTVENGAGIGINFYGNAQLKNFNNVTVTSHAKEPIRLNVEQATALLNGGSDFTGNTNDYVYLNTASVDNPSTLHKLSVPYYVDDNDYINVTSSLTIDPGVEIRFNNDAGILISSGSISAVGSSTSPINFKGFVDAKGTWDGIEIESINPANELRYVNISNAGYSRVTCCDSPAAIKIESAAIATVENATISDTKGCGILYDPESTTVTLNNITYNNNDNDTCDL